MVFYDWLRERGHDIPVATTYEELKQMFSSAELDALYQIYYEEAHDQ